MAKAGRGAAEFTLEGEAMEAKVMRQLQRALCPELRNVRPLLCKPPLSVVLTRFAAVPGAADSGWRGIRQLLDVARTARHAVSKRHHHGIPVVQGATTPGRRGTCVGKHSHLQPRSDHNVFARCV
jgi:hypothetical protein